MLVNQSNYQIKLLQQLGKDLFRLVLLPDVLASALKFIAGQYIQVLYPDQTYQPFSIANAPTNEGVIELLIRLQSDDVATDAFLNQCRSNQKVILRGPFGDAYYRSDARPMLVLAAGTGFAYAKAIIEQAIQTDHSRFIHFYWGVKRPEDFCLPDLLKSWQTQNHHFHYTQLISQPNDQWKGAVGYVPPQVINDYSDLSQYIVYASGPHAMIQAAWQLFQQKNLPRQQIYSDLL